MADKETNTRIDKWLWSVRLYKTRSIATDACKNGAVKLNGANTKPSKDVKIGDKITVKRKPIILQIEVKAFPKSRVGAKLVEEYMINHTPEEEYDKLKMGLQSVFVKRDLGTGRPTKKDRRDIDDFDLFEWLDGEDE
jgi:ribosome-associated heat shock protein Hsp15